MNVQVLFHVGLLIKPSITVLVLADKGLFHGVDSQMIEKIMPLSKNFVTVFMRTAEQSYHPSIWLKASEFKNVKLRSLWSILRLNGRQIKVLPFQNNYRVPFIIQIDCWIPFFLFCQIYLEVEAKLIFNFLS
jgi:hypothetical protein